MKKAAFSLTELLVYLTLFMFLAHLLFSSVTNLQLELFSQGRGITRQAEALMAFDCIVRDLRTAPSALVGWKKIAPQECIWHAAQKNKDLCWAIQDDRLLRIVGTYDERTGVWLTKRRDVVMQGVVEISLTTLQRHGQMCAVACELMLQGEKNRYALKQWVTIRERAL